MGCDDPAQYTVSDKQYFNPRTPGGVRLLPSSTMPLTKRFQSTHPGWGATIGHQNPIRIFSNFNPRTPGGVRLIQNFKSLTKCNFNPRTPGGVRLTIFAHRFAHHLFQSTHPGWGATWPMVCNFLLLYHFNPRTPGGVRPITRNTITAAIIGFQSTHPGWGATSVGNVVGDVL